MNYEVRFIDDDDLPERQEWALMLYPHKVLLVLKRSHVTEANLQAAWAGYRSLLAEQRLHSPQRLTTAR